MEEQKNLTAETEYSPVEIAERFPEEHRKTIQDNLEITEIAMRNYLFSLIM